MPLEQRALSSTNLFITQWFWPFAVKKSTIVYNENDIWVIKRKIDFHWSAECAGELGSQIDFEQMRKADGKNVIEKSTKGHKLTNVYYVKVS